MHVVTTTSQRHLFGQVYDLSKVKTVIVDKDMNDIFALQKDMPQASLQICYFHGLQAITREVRKKYGKRYSYFQDLRLCPKFRTM